MGTSKKVTGKENDGRVEKLGAPPQIQGDFETEDGVEWPSSEQLCGTFGTTSPYFAKVELTRLIASFPAGVREPYTNAALVMIDASRPTNEIEALLAMQIYATHIAAMDMLSRASQSQFATEMAAKFLQVFTAQVDAFVKLRPGSSFDGAEQLRADQQSAVGRHGRHEKQALGDR